MLLDAGTPLELADRDGFTALVAAAAAPEPVAAEVTALLIAQAQEDHEEEKAWDDWLMVWEAAVVKHGDGDAVAGVDSRPRLARQQLGGAVGQEPFNVRRRSWAELIVETTTINAELHGCDGGAPRALRFEAVHVSGAPKAPHTCIELLPPALARIICATDGRALA